MSDIFYTSVDDNLRKELLARASAGKKNRTTKDINFMVSKIANVQITPFDIKYVDDPTKPNDEVVDQKTAILPAILGGLQVRQGEFLPTGPQGYITDRKFTVTDATGDVKTPFGKTNTSKRIPPYLTGVEISIGDDSMGIMQTATANVTIPNPGRDLDYFESVYLRPGRHVRVFIAHPDTAIVSEDTDGFLTPGSMPSTEKLKNLYPNITEEEERQYKRMNSFVFDGVIISFTLDYQEDASVAVSLTMRGTSQVYTDLSMAMSDAAKKDESDTQSTIMKNFYDEINNIVEKQLDNEEFVLNASAIYNNTTDRKLKDVSYIWGAPYAGQPIKKYITLKALIEFINQFIITKAKSIVGNVSIVFDRDINTCKYYPDLVSADPETVFFPGQDNYGARTWYENFNTDKPKFSDANNENPVSFCTLMYISMEFIQTTLNNMNKEEIFTVNEFLKRISAQIYYVSGGAYDLKLITHPENQNALLYYDSNNVKSFSDVPQPFAVPMFANDPTGTVVKSFSFNGKLPSDASNLAYVLNQDPGDISESEIAPFLSYMYSANTVSRTEDGNETISNIVSADTVKKIEEKYKTRHEQYLNELKTAIKTWGQDHTDENQEALHTAVKNHIQYPKPKLEDTNQLKAPVIPFNASFTIEGINGFRYGDVLEFKGLPARYTNNTVFSIIGINHSVSATGEWNTDIQCIMRPRIDFKE